MQHPALESANGHPELDRDAVHALLEEKFPRWQDVRSIPVMDNGEKLIDLCAAHGLAARVYETQIRSSSGTRIFVRPGLAERLREAQDWLKDQGLDCRLEVFYGYRSPAIQQETFEKTRIQMGLPEQMTDEQMERVHRFIAVPEIAGHPTGGAVDLTLIDDHTGAPLDMGTRPHAFEKESYTFSPFISRGAWINRQFLRAAMMSAGFAPFDGEWWHFSYGDREWAKYWNKSHAIYDQTSCPVPE